ncbi:MAG: glycosyltransferase family 2 protein [Bryobacteraceae bacterium]
MLSLIIPIYRNEANLDALLPEIVKLNDRFGGDFEAVFVVDGSPDRCHEILSERLRQTALRSQLLLLSRNFGSFAAVTAGLEAARGDYFAVIAADLQEPPELVTEFLEILADDRADVVFGTRQSRSDPFLSELASNAFWSIYRRLVIKDMPRGGVDIFACNRTVRERLLQFRENNTNLIALLFWMGFRRSYVPYERKARLAGKSAWTFKKKLRYCVNSIFNFTDLPVQVLLYTGSVALVLACVGAILVIIGKLTGHIGVHGYAAIIVAIFFFGALTSLGLGIVGQYLWLTLQNTRARPNYIVHRKQDYDC